MADKILTYCMKCKKQTETANPQEVIYENRGHKMKRLSGECMVCKTKKSKILGKA